MSGLLGPVTANPLMLAQSLKAREQPRKQLTGQGLLDTAAIGLSPVPVIGDAIGLAADASRFYNEPESRTPLNFGLAALGLIPFVPPLVSAGLGKFAQSQGKTLSAPSMTGPARNQAGAIVYHGSPHKFDAFDSSKIGTGEGAQAYGHGLYFAESPDVAKSYQTALAGTTVPDIEGMASKIGIPKISPDTRVEIMRQAKDGVPSDIAAKRLTYASTELRNQPVEKLQSLIDQYREAKNFGGSLYKVDLPDEAIAKMLDWGKPLSQQSDYVKSVLKSRGYDVDGKLSGSSVREIYNGIAAKSAREAKKAGLLNESVGIKTRGVVPVDFVGASGNLNQAGIPGIKYLDHMSRLSGNGTNNFVVFPGNEGLLKILERQ